MPEVQEVFRMATQKVKPDPGALERQFRGQRRRTTRRKAGVYGLVAAILIGAAVVAATAIPQDERGTPGTRPSTVAPLYVPAATRPFVLDLLTGETTPLAENLAGSNFAASSDGSVLAYVKTGAEGSPQVFVAGIDGTGIRQVTHDPGGATTPAWSPDGTQIAYVGLRSLFVLDVATGVSTNINEGGAMPQFTPDGSSIVYTGGTSARPELRTVPVAGGKSTLLVEPRGGIGDSGQGSISPDGTMVTYLGGGTPTSGEVEHCGPCRFVANVDGSGRRVIEGWQANPAGTWSPDGTRIVSMDFLGEVDPEASRPGDEIIVVTDVATGEATKVAEGRAAVWLDDHTLLVEGPTALEIARRFVEAYGAFDAERAVSYLADDADISALFSPGQPQDLRLLTSFLEAQGYNQMLGPCEALGSSASVTSFQCPFDFHAIRSAEIGLDLQLSVEERPPYSGSYFELIVRDGEIVRASVYLETAEFGPQLWEPFADWVSTNHPRDAAVMYNEDLTDFRLTEESIRLWERHTRGYVKELAGR